MPFCSCRSPFPYFLSGVPDHHHVLSAPSRLGFIGPPSLPVLRSSHTFTIILACPFSDVICPRNSWSSLFPCILPFSKSICSPFCLTISPKYWPSRFLILSNSDLLVFIMLNTSSSFLCSMYEILHFRRLMSLGNLTAVFMIRFLELHLEMQHIFSCIGYIQGV